MSATPGMRSSGVRQTKQTRQTDRPTARQPASQRQTDRQTDRRPARQTDKRSFRFKEPVRHWVLNYFIDIDDNDDDDDGGGDDDHDYRMMTMMAVMTAIMMTIVVATIPFAYYMSPSRMADGGIKSLDIANIGHSAGLLESARLGPALLVSAR